MNDITQNTIIEAAGGDIRAFEDIYRHYSSYVYTLSYRVVGNAEDAEEVAQDVFVKIYKNLRKFKFGSALKTWIYRITANEAINFVKRNNKKRKINYHIADLENIARSPEVDEGLEDAKDVVRSMLRVLPVEQRACVVLRNMQGLKYDEIAKVLKINVNTVRTRLRRAREKLISLYRGKEMENEVR